MALDFGTHDGMGAFGKDRRMESLEEIPIRLQGIRSDRGILGGLKNFPKPPEKTEGVRPEVDRPISEQGQDSECDFSAG
jgi:hypothetical protein